jgi:hypothetical protein
MYEITYHLKDPILRSQINLTNYTQDWYRVVSKFPMIKLVDITPRDYTITVNTRDVLKKNRIVRAFGSEFAKTSALGVLVEHRVGSSTLFVEKEIYEY